MFFKIVLSEACFFFGAPHEIVRQNNIPVCDRYGYVDLVHIVLLVMQAFNQLIVEE